MNTSPYESILDALWVGANGQQTDVPEPVAQAHKNILSWIDRRYSDFDLSKLKNGPLSAAQQKKFVRWLKNEHAERDIELLSRIMGLQQQVLQAPRDVTSALGVNLENIEAQNITIKDIYVNLPKPAEAIEFHCIVAYLERVTELISEETNAFDNSDPLPAKQKLDTTPVHVRTMGGDPGERISVVSAVQDHFARDRQIERIQRVVLLGEAGCGKTAALFQLRQNLAHKSLSVPFTFSDDGQMVFPDDVESDGFVIPIYINLTDLTNGNTLATLIRDEFNRHCTRHASFREIAAEQVPELLDRYTCLFLLDTLDARIADRAALQQVRQFMEHNHREQYVITCRHGTYRGQLGAIPMLLVDELSHEETVDILGSERQAVLNNSLQQLTHNRLMLRVIVDLEAMNQSSEMLENKGQLIQQLTRERLKIMLGESDETFLDLETAESLLEHIAYHMYRDRVYRYHERELMLVIKAYLDEWHEPYHWREVVRALAGIKMLQKDGPRKWRLRDRTTGAYFAAAAMVHESSLLEPVMEEISDLWWRDVFELLAGLIHNPTRFFFDLMDRDILIAAHVAQYRRLSHQVTDALIDTLIERMSHEDTFMRERIAVLLGESGHDRAAEALIRALHQEWASNVILAIAHAAWNWTNQKSQKAIESAERDIIARSPIHLESFVELLDIFQQLIDERKQKVSHSKDLLLERMLDPKRSRLSRGLCAIGLGFTPGDETVKCLLSVAMSEEEDDLVAWCAVEALAYANPPSLEAQATDMLSCEDDHKVHCKHRVRAAYLLGWVCSGTATRRLLRNSALRDPNPHVRGYAVESLLRLDLPDARDHIEKRLVDENHPIVIHKCAEALGRIGTVASLHSLERHLYNPRARTRWRVQQAIAEIRLRSGST